MNTNERLKAALTAILGWRESDHNNDMAGVVCWIEGIATEALQKLPVGNLDNEENFIIHTLVRQLGKHLAWQQRIQIAEAIASVQFHADSMRKESEWHKQQANALGQTFVDPVTGSDEG